MTPSELRAIRTDLGLTQDALATTLGVSRRAVVYWEQGDRPIPQPVAMLLQLLIENPGILELFTPS